MAQARKQPPQTPALEWIAAGIGLALLLFVAVVIGRDALFAKASQLPAIEVRVVRVVPAPAGFVVEFEAENRASGTAAAVEIEGRLGSEADPVETSSATLDYVPGHSAVRGGLFFTKDPRQHAIEVRAMGFQTP